MARTPRLTNATPAATAGRIGSPKTPMAPAAASTGAIPRMTG
jgi:hypothetical protein